jgi:hypothetical protein
VCNFSGTWQTTCLSCVQQKTLGKVVHMATKRVYRVPKVRDTRQTANTQQRKPMPSAGTTTHGKGQCLLSPNGRHSAKLLSQVTPWTTVRCLPSVNGRHSANLFFAECRSTSKRQRVLFAECSFVALGKLFFLLFSSQTFSTVDIQYLLLHVEVLYICLYFYYISLFYFS